MIGEKLGKYTILEIVGTGSMGTVYKAEDPDGKLVALKLVRSQVLYNMEKRERFLQCALIASEIRHDSICPILEIGDDNDDFFIIMPFISGKPLDRYMERKPLPWPHALDIAKAIGAALSAIHKAGVAHRGLKPTNIWISEENGLSITLSDCCIARFTEIMPRNRACTAAAVNFADSLVPLEALSYMSPEQVRGESLDCRTDIFSYGIVLFEMLTGRHPFEARNSLSRISAILEAAPPLLVSKQASIPAQLEPIARKALAKSREDRYQSVSEFMEALEKARAAAALEAIPSGTSAGIRKWFASRFRRG
jgi:eukaryotic-like serine/threonine-protein kinase